MQLDKILNKIEWEEYYNLKEVLKKNKDNYFYHFKNYEQKAKFIELSKNYIKSIKYLKVSNGHLNKSTNYIGYFHNTELKIKKYLISNPNQFNKLNILLKFLDIDKNKRIYFNSLFYINSNNKKIISFGNIINFNTEILFDFLISNKIYMATANQIKLFNLVETKLNNLKF